MKGRELVVGAGTGLRSRSRELVVGASTGLRSRKRYTRLRPRRTTIFNKPLGSCSPKCRKIFRKAVH